MLTSESIKEISNALCEAQKEIQNATKDGSNPYFSSRYATLSSVLDCIKEPANKNGISYFQAPSFQKEDGSFVLITRIMHKSGEFIEFESPLLVSKQDMQGLGSAITYMRRYSIASAFGLTQEDDDGNKSIETKQKTEPRQSSNVSITINKEEKSKPYNHAPKGIGKLSEAQVNRLKAIMKTANANGGKWTPSSFDKLVKDAYGQTDVYNISKIEYDELCAAIEAGSTLEDIVTAKGL